MGTLTIHLGERSYPIHVAPGILDRAGALMVEALGPCRCAIITDDQVGPLYLRRLEESLQGAGLSCAALTLPAGEPTKSLASLGGYLAAKSEVVEYVRHCSRPFIFSASITPASVECARAALRILKREPERIAALSHAADFMLTGLKARKVKLIESSTPIIPIYTYEDERTFRVCKRLLEKGVYVNPVISPATPVGESLLRTSYTATHTEQQLTFAMDRIAEALEEIPASGLTACAAAKA